MLFLKQIQKITDCLFAAYLIVPILCSQANAQLNESAVLAILSQMQEDLKRFESAQKKLPPAAVRLGERLFFDVRLSASGKISCATCHSPQHGFSDAKEVAEGMARGARNTPSVFYAAMTSWFFWDGRSPTAAAQALGPLEAVKEHGTTRALVARLIASDADLRKLFNEAFPEEVATIDWSSIISTKSEATPRPKSAVVLSDTMNAYSLRTLSGFWRRTDIIVSAFWSGRQPAKEFSARLEAILTPPPSAEQELRYAAWDSLSENTKNSIDAVYLQIGRAIAAFEFALPHPKTAFDEMRENSLATSKLQTNQTFDSQALAGLNLFYGKAKCVLCHSGSILSDNQFHNIGLKWGKYDDLGNVMGRAVGVAKAKSSASACAPELIVSSLTNNDACEEIKYLKTDALEMVGAFKTPMLRYLNLTAPYFHDGRAKSLEEVIEFYNSPDDEPAIGFREETVAPLGLTAAEKASLVKFLSTL